MSDQPIPPFPEVDGVEFRPVKDWPAYCVGTDGSFWSRWRVCSGGSRLGNKWRRLFGSRRRHGHLLTTLHDSNGFSRQVFIHILVLESFAGSCPVGLECCHKDGDPANNRLDNLRWDTHKANAADMIRHGRSSRGSKHGMSKLTEKQVREIDERLRAGEDYRSIASDYGVEAEAIHKIKSGSRWQWLTNR